MSRFGYMISTEKDGKRIKTCLNCNTVYPVEEKVCPVCEREKARRITSASTSDTNLPEMAGIKNSQPSEKQRMLYDEYVDVMKLLMSQDVHDNTKLVLSSQILSMAATMWCLYKYLQEFYEQPSHKKTQKLSSLVIKKINKVIPLLKSSINGLMFSLEEIKHPNSEMIYVTSYFEKADKCQDYYPNPLYFYDILPNSYEAIHNDIDQITFIVISLSHFIIDRAEEVITSSDNKNKKIKELYRSIRQKIKELIGTVKLEQEI